MRKRSLKSRLPLVAIGLLFAAAPFAMASPQRVVTTPATTGGTVSHGMKRILGSRVDRVRGGLFAVRVPRGPTLITHGPDTELKDEVQAHSNGGADTSGERPPVCADDHYQRFLYARVDGATNRLVAVRPTIQKIARQMDATLNLDSLDSGARTADYRVLCGLLGEVRVDGFSAPSSDFSSVVDAARAAGFDDATADYTVFIDASSTACGIGSYWRDETAGVSNVSNQVGGYAVVYSGCWNAQVAMHENGHNEGAVQSGAPNSTGTGGHCFDERDAMCYSPDGGSRHQGGAILRCADRLHFDCGYNDYFDSAPEPGEYLAHHWNLGSNANQSMAFGRGSQLFPVETLRRGVPTLGAANGPGGWRYYRIRTTLRSKWLRFRVSGPACSAGGCPTNLDLYALHGWLPNRLLSRCRSTSGGSQESCRIRRARRGTWYLGVRTRWGRRGAPYGIRVDYKR